VGSSVSTVIRAHLKLVQSLKKKKWGSNKQKSMISVKAQKSILWCKNQYSWQKTSDPHWGPTDIWRHPIKFSRPDDLAPGICAAPGVDHLSLYDCNKGPTNNSSKRPSTLNYRESVGKYLEHVCDTAEWEDNSWTLNLVPSLHPTIHSDRYVKMHFSLSQSDVWAIKDILC
jgi:hypothetical protein